MSPEPADRSAHGPGEEKVLPATVAEITETDLDDVADFLARQIRPGEAIAPGALPPRDRLRWLLLENPSRAPGIPLGWCVRAENGAVVGAAVCIPVRIASADFAATALMFAKFFVDLPYRGMGLGIFMRFVREAQKFPAFSTSTNVISGQLFSRMGGARIPGLDHTMLGICTHRPVVEEWLYRKTGSATPARIMALPAALVPGKVIGRSSDSIVQLQPLQSADEVIALHLPPPADRIATVRDRAFLHWRYFSGDRGKHVLSFRFTGEGDRMVVINNVRSGHRGQIRVLNVLDVWPPLSSDSAPALAAALAREHRGSFDAMWVRSQPMAAEEAMRQAGFVRHLFPAPLGWFIDRGNLLPKRDWYCVPGESE